MPDRKTVILSYANGAVLNPVVDYIFEEKADLIERLDDFTLIEGPAALIGSGEHAIVTIKITYEDPSKEDLKAIEQIIAKAKESANDLNVTLEI